MSSFKIDHTAECKGELQRTGHPIAVFVKPFFLFGRTQSKHQHCCARSPNPFTDPIALIRVKLKPERR